MLQVYKFIDFSGCEIHKIDDPDDKLSIPANKKLISIGTDRMLVESVETFGEPGVCTVYFARVQTAAGTN